jgi:hypothetical protein
MTNDTNGSMAETIGAVTAYSNMVFNRTDIPEADLMVIRDNIHQIRRITAAHYNCDIASMLVRADQRPLPHDAAALFTSLKTWVNDGLALTSKNACV